MDEKEDKDFLNLTRRLEDEIGIEFSTEKEKENYLFKTNNFFILLKKDGLIYNIEFHTNNNSIKTKKMIFKSILIITSEKFLFPDKEYAILLNIYMYKMILYSIKNKKSKNSFKRIFRLTNKKYNDMMKKDFLYYIQNKYKNMIIKNMIIDNEIPEKKIDVILLKDFSRILKENYFFFGIDKTTINKSIYISGFDLQPLIKKNSIKLKEETIEIFIEIEEAKYLKFKKV